MVDGLTFALPKGRILAGAAAILAAAGTPAWWDWLVQAGRLVGPVLAFKLALLALC